MTRFQSLCWFAVLLSFTLLSSVLAVDLAFRDVTAKVGIQQTPLNKYGGPVIADINNDGFYDLILSYHKSAPVEIYLGTRRGIFTKSPFSAKADNHGISVAPLTAVSKDKLIVISRGGRGGTRERLPLVFLSSPNQTITDVSEKMGFGNPETKGRGRISFFMDLSLKTQTGRSESLGGPDLLIDYFIGPDPSLANRAQFAFENNQGNFRFLPVPSFADRSGRVALVDIDGDRVMEVISMTMFGIQKLVAPFTFADVTAEVAPDIAIPHSTINGAVAFDMDNDGDFDLYLARGFEDLPSNMAPVRGQKEYRDILLENRNGVYVDVSNSANIIGLSRSMAVSAADFNNDGFVDLIVTQETAEDTILLNNGNGTFTHFNPEIVKPADTGSENSLAFDYDLDGRVDIMTAQGQRKRFNGVYKLLRNVMPLTGTNNFLLVRVGNDPKRRSTALHAVVTLITPLGRMVRVVGANGVQKAGPGSFFDTVHFGLGSVSKVALLTVRWSSGLRRRKRNVSAGSRIGMGAF